MIRREYHGLRGSSEYKIWAGIKQRCRNPKNPNFARYGGSGITMCDRWANSFTAFLSDMGVRPSMEHSVDRQDGSKGYEPGNCRWATDIEQAQNQSTTRFLAFDGETLCLSEWARRKKIPLVTLWHRLESGRTIEQALSTPTKGIRSGSKLLDSDVIVLRERAASGESIRNLASDFQIHYSTAYRIIIGRSFKDVSGAEQLALSEGR